MRRTFGPYELVARLGSGPSGDVHLAHLSPGALLESTREDEVLAIRIYHEETAGQAAFVDMLRSERPSAIAFRHETAVRTLEIGGGEGEELYLAMELVEGQPLTHLLQRVAFERQRLSDGLVLWIGVQVAEVLFAAHQTPWQTGADVGMSHGGLSPNAIALTYDGQIRVRGIGVGRANLILRPSHMRLAYRAPELIEGRGCDRRADIYALGVILYDMLSPRRAFKRRTVEDTQAAVLEHFVEPLESVRGDLPGSLTDLVATMMSRTRADRPKSMADVIPTLKAHLKSPTAALQTELRTLMNGQFGGEAKSQRKMIDAVLRPRGDAPKRPPSSPRRPPLEANTEIQIDRSVEVLSPSESGEEELVLAKPVEFITPPAGRMSEKPALEPTTDISSTTHALDLPPPSSSDEFVVLSDELANFLASQPQPKVHRSNGRDGPEIRKVRAPEDPAFAPTFQPKSSDEESDETGEGTSDELAIGQLIGEKYRVLGRLGEGGMGVVYRVEHVLMQKELALKLLRAEISMIPQIARRFEREARAACKLDHPNIVRVTDFGREPNGTLFLVMELLQGESLLDRLAVGAHLNVEEALQIIEQVLAALEHAHKHEVVHRDLKPDNVMLVPKDGRLVVKILDFGVAKMAALPIEKDHPPLTQTGMIFGTPQYMSPEQASGEPVDGRADLYTVGVMLYQILTKRLPFDGETTQAVLARQITQPPPALGLMLPCVELEVALEAVLRVALAKERDKRYQTPAAFKEAIQNLDGRKFANEAWTVPVQRPAVQQASLADDLMLPQANERIVPTQRLSSVPAKS